MGEAADRYAAVSREQFENYKKFGYPIEDSLIGMIGDKAALGANMERAQGIASTIGSVAASETDRNMRGYGIATTQDQEATNLRLNNLSTTASMANARNFVRGATLDREKQIIVGGAPNDGLPTV